MSIKVSALVWKSGDIDHAELTMMLALAWFADDGGTCWPSVGTLAVHCRVSRRHALRVLRGLQDKGLVVAVRRGQHATNRWVLNVERLRSEVTPTSPLRDGPEVTPTSSEVTPTSSRGDTHVTQNRQEPSLEPCKQTAADAPAPAPVVVGDLVPYTPAPPAPSNGNGHPGSGFEEFWALYPRKVAKGAARSAWGKAVADAPAASILAGLRANLHHFDTDHRYVPHPATWLRQQRWQDEPTAPTTPRSQFVETTERALELIRQRYGGEHQG